MNVATRSDRYRFHAMVEKADLEIDRIRTHSKCWLSILWHFPLNATRIDMCLGERIPSQVLQDPRPEAGLHVIPESHLKARACLANFIQFPVTNLLAKHIIRQSACIDTFVSAAAIVGYHCLGGMGARSGQNVFSNPRIISVSYTHLTLPTICSV